jgi:hypothetical protein
MAAGRTAERGELSALAGIPPLVVLHFFHINLGASSDSYSNFSNVYGHARPRRSQASFGSLSLSAQPPFWQPPGIPLAAKLFLDAIFSAK